MISPWRKPRFHCCSFRVHTAVKYAEVRTWLNTFIEQTMQGDALTTVDGTTMKMLVDRIQIRNEGIVVEFKCGVAIEQEYVK